MDRLATEQQSAYPPLANGKFRDPDRTLTDEVRASVDFRALETLWINTGTLCNIACVNCYIDSSPVNDRLAFISAPEAASFFDEIGTLDLATREIGFTGGEPFMNPDMIAMTRDALTRGFSVLILTNAMQPMQRPQVKSGLLALKDTFGERLSLRVSLDHHTQRLHETERGPNTWSKTLDGLDWLTVNGFRFSIAGRTCWGETESSERAGYGRFFRERGYRLDETNPADLVLFPEMDSRLDIPEITTSCWSLLNVDPDAMMCATSRMVVKHRGEDKPSLMPCTLLPYDRHFRMGATLAESREKDGGNFRSGAVKLNHPHCARFCVLGGGSCSAGSD
ncbi:MAG: radical SAM protein [Fimbriimonadaceae bacterium]|nr:radical SAM protein [Alphaproteobacteria bacterium]